MAYSPHEHTASDNRYKNHRFPAEIISLAIWLNFRFRLSYRDNEYRSTNLAKFSVT